jgi:hypothetical protein
MSLTSKRSIGLNPFEDVIVSGPSSEMITLTLNKITGIFQHVLWHGSLHNSPKKCCFVFRNFIHQNVLQRVIKIGNAVSKCTSLSTLCKSVPSVLNICKGCKALTYSLSKFTDLWVQFN